MNAIRKPKATHQRQRLIRLIHVAKRDLAMDEETYRAALQRVGKKDSAAAMTIPELEKVLEHLKRSGFKVRSKRKPSRALALDAESRKIRALWLFLHQLGAVKNPAEEALAAYVKRITGVDALQWLSGDQSETLIETLKKWAMRLLPDAVRALMKQVELLPLSYEERRGLNIQLADAFARHTYDPMQAAWASLTDVLARGK